MDLDALTLGALERLGGRTRLIPGATLSLAVARLAAEQGADFKQALKSQGLTFKTFVLALPGVSVLEVQGRDIKVKLGAIDPEAATAADKERQRHKSYIRKDVYEAFTRMTPAGYAYILDRDRFVPKEKVSVALPVRDVPSRTFEELLASRQRFIDDTGIQDTARNSLTAALHGPSPLKSFSTTVGELELSEQWRQFQYEVVKADVLEWCSLSNVPVRENWFTSFPVAEPERAAAYSFKTRGKLRQLLDSLSDDDLGKIYVPLRLIERLLK